MNNVYTPDTAFSNLPNGTKMEKIDGRWFIYQPSDGRCISMDELMSKAVTMAVDDLSEQMHKELDRPLTDDEIAMVEREHQKGTEMLKGWLNR